MNYCEFVAQLGADSDNPHKQYHDNEYGFEIESDDALFGRLVLEINQAGLSWTTILNKQENFYKAYDAFNIGKVARYREGDIARLLQDKGIIRNKLKINAAIYNANRIVELQKEYGSFKNWLELNLGKTREEWVLLFKKNFKFVGGEIVNEFLMSIGFLKGAHVPECIIYQKYIRDKPKWL